MRNHYFDYVRNLIDSMYKLAHYGNSVLLQIFNYYIGLKT